MHKLVQGIHHFQKSVFRSKRELFKKLSEGQRPSALFITCADSRVNPNLLTQTDPGEIFILRNAGNIIPAAPHGGGEIATVEFALEGLDIQDIIVCGHSDCGAIKALIEPGDVSAKMPAVSDWLSHAKKAVEAVKPMRADTCKAHRLNAAVEENVLVQIENLRTHSVIERRLKDGKLRIHGWVYRFETGQVFAYDSKSTQFEALTREAMS